VPLVEPELFTFNGVRIAQSSVVFVLICGPLPVLLSFYWPLYSLFFDVWLLITRLVPHVIFM